MGLLFCFTRPMPHAEKFKAILNLTYGLCCREFQSCLSFVPYTTSEAYFRMKSCAPHTTSEGYFHMKSQMKSYSKEHYLPKKQHKVAFDPVKDGKAMGCTKGCSWRAKDCHKTEMLG